MCLPCSNWFASCPCLLSLQMTCCMHAVLRLQQCCGAHFTCGHSHLALLPALVSGFCVTSCVVPSILLCSLTPTAAGKLMAAHFLKLRTMASIVQLGERPNVPSLLRVICSAEEFKSASLRRWAPHGSTSVGLSCWRCTHALRLLLRLLSCWSCCCADLAPLC